MTVINHSIIMITVRKSFYRTTAALEQLSSCKSWRSEVLAPFQLWADRVMIDIDDFPTTSGAFHYELYYRQRYPT